MYQHSYPSPCDMGSHRCASFVCCTSGQPTVMVVSWSILGIKRVTEWMWILHKEHGHKLLVSTISSSFIVDTVKAGKYESTPLWKSSQLDFTSFGLWGVTVEVAALAPNVPAMHELNFAVPMAGAVLCTLNICHDSAMLSILLRHSEAKVIFVHYKLLEIAHGAPDLLASTETRPLCHKAEVMTRSSPPPPQIFLNMEEMGFEVSQMYGLTETYGPRILAA
ncbi:hypothetical protein RHSIM_Rhsim10G0201200 [Rhododendron simsii]|uniref:AMP-dependent synthetase/ligase domain-containing protein n=1 Tax=Rhododendron simsii TaxID=118357 RepID=A0A834G9V8_RHOSS|nr:hypothetical protein RHSIM_Rhsim10G0201200 [Rhododendron simsii]